MKTNFINIVFLFFLLLFTQCEEDRFDSESIEITAVNRTVSTSVAQEFVNQLESQVFNSSDQLKSGHFSKRTINELEAITDGDDTLLYVTNFNGNKGFMILSADKSTFPVVAFSESGSFNPQRLDSASSEWLSSQITALKMARSLPLDTLNDNYQLWHSVETCKEAESYALTLIKDDSPSELKSLGKLLSWPDIVPLCYMTNFGQYIGYNYYCPKVTGQVFDSYGRLVSDTKKAPVGCVAVAMGQIMYRYLYPENWSYHWMSLGPIPQNSTNDVPNQTAQMLFDIGTAVGMKYSYDGSGPDSPYNIINAFKWHFGYSSPGELIEYNLSRVYSDLRLGRPVILLGKGSEFAHAWIADGFKKLQITTKTRKKFLGIGYKTITTTVYKDYLHMNWGFNGDMNGYYEHTDWWKCGDDKKVIVGIHP